MPVPEVFFIASAPVIVSPPISTYLLSASLWSSMFAVPHVSVPSLCVVIIEQLERLVTAREVPVIPPATSSFVPGVVSPMPTLPSAVNLIFSTGDAPKLYVRSPLFLSIKMSLLLPSPMPMYGFPLLRPNTNLDHESPASLAFTANDAQLAEFECACVVMVPYSFTEKLYPWAPVTFRAFAPALPSTSSAALGEEVRMPTSPII